MIIQLSDGTYVDTSVPVGHIKVKGRQEPVYRQVVPDAVGGGGHSSVSPDPNISVAWRTPPPARQLTAKPKKKSLKQQRPTLITERYSQEDVGRILEAYDEAGGSIPWADLERRFGIPHDHCARLVRLHRKAYRRVRGGKGSPPKVMMADDIRKDLDIARKVCQMHKKGRTAEDISEALNLHPGGVSDYIDYLSA